MCCGRKGGLATIREGTQGPVRGAGEQGSPIPSAHSFHHSMQLLYSTLLYSTLLLLLLFTPQ